MICQKNLKSLGYVYEQIDVLILLENEMFIRHDGIKFSLNPYWR